MYRKSYAQITTHDYKCQKYRKITLVSWNCFPCNGNNNFDCSTAQKNIRENYDEMTHLPINSMLNKLYSKDVITLDQKKRIKACPVETEQMEYLLDNIIIPSLQCDNIRKFKGLFEIMKDSGDSTLTATAEKLSNH